MRILDYVRSLIRPEAALDRPPPAEDAAAILRRARRLRFRVPTRGLSDLVGAYAGARPGLGLAFAELKPYEPGDDVRHIDWNVTARQERPYVRRYLEERSLTVWIVVDVSAGMRFGAEGRSKADRATQAAALLATAAVRNGDRVGLLLVSDRVEVELRPAVGPRHAARVLRMLVASPAASRKTRLASAVDRIGSTTRRALIVVLSDFVLEPDDQGSAWRRLGLHNRIVAFRVVDPLESSLPVVGLIDVQDAETGRRRVVDAGSASVRAAYGEAVAARLARFRAWCVAAKAGGSDFSTAVDPLTPLLRHFSAEARGGPR